MKSLQENSKHSYILPDDNCLANGIASSLSLRRERIEIVDRIQNPYASSYPSEIVTYTINGKKKLRTLCKYSNQCMSRVDRRRGIAYEGAVYERVLSQLDCSFVKYIGSFKDGKSGTSCLAIEFIEDAKRVSRVPVAEGLIVAAVWIADFHRKFENMSTENVPFEDLRVCDHKYFTEWKAADSVFSMPWRGRFPELQPIHEHLPQMIDVLTSQEQTCIHAEYYPKNILLRDGEVFPIDWESAALGSGEIDLAALTEGWEPETVAECEKVYCSVRWPSGVPKEFAERIRSARLYWHLNWLGCLRQWEGHVKGGDLRMVGLIKERVKDTVMEFLR